MPAESRAKEVTSAVVSVIVSVLRISSLVEGREETMGDADTEDGEGEGGGRDGDGTRGMGMGEETPVEFVALDGDRRGEVDELEKAVATESNVDSLEFHGPGPYGDWGID